MDNIKWLAWLQEEIWELHTDSRSRMNYAMVKRKLTPDESKRLKEIAETHEFIVAPCSMDFGFGFGLAFHVPGSFPGVPAEFIFCVNGKHLPEHIEGGSNFDMSWHLLSPLSHNPENSRLLTLYGFGEPQNKEQYYY